MTEKVIQILLVDDHQLVRQGMSMLINGQDDMSVVYDCASVQEAKQVMKASTHNLNIVIVDITLEGASGFELIKWIRVNQPKVLTLVVSMHDELLYAERAISTGARGYIMKQEASEKVIKGIRDAMRGELVVSDEIRSRINGIQEHTISESLLQDLTATEYEVLQLLGQGKSTNEIAKINSRSVKTIEAHRANIRRKLGLPDGNALLMFAIKMHSALTDIS